MQITLNIKGKDRSFTAPFVSARKLRTTIAMSNDLKDKVQDETMVDNMVNYIVDIFGNQFTSDDFYDGYAADKVIETFNACVLEVTGKLADKAEKIAMLQGKNE